MIVICAIWLNVSVVLIKAEADPAAESPVVPWGGTITLPIFSSIRVKENTVDGDAKGLVDKWGRFISHLRPGRNAVMIVLFSNGVRITSIRKLAGGMVGNAVGFDDAKVPLHFDRNATLHRWLDVSSNGDSRPFLWPGWAMARGEVQTSTK